MRVVGVESPCGIAWERAARDVVPVDAWCNGVMTAVDPDRVRDLLESAFSLPQESVCEPDWFVVTDLHLASRPGVEGICGLIDTHRAREANLVLCSAGPMPVHVRARVDTSFSATCLDLEEFEDATGYAVEAWKLSGGFPEAICPTGMDHSAKLELACRALREQAHDAWHVLAIAAATRGVTVAALSRCLEITPAQVLQIVANLEDWGFVAWSGTDVVPAFPAVGSAVLTNETDRVATLALVSDELSASDPVAAAKMRLGAGLSLGETDASTLISAMQSAERSADMDSRLELATLAAGSADESLAREGLVDLCKLSLLRGRTKETDQLIDALRQRFPEDPRIPLLEGVLQACRLEARSLRSATTPTGMHLRTLLPRIVASRQSHHPFPTTADLTDIEHGSPAIDLSSEIGYVLAATWSAARGDIDPPGIPDDAAFPLGILADTVEMLVLLASGRYVDAGRLLSEWCGPDWRSVDSPLHRAVALHAATGLDLSRVRGLLRVVEPPHPGVLFGPLVLGARMKAFELTGLHAEAVRSAEALLEEIEEYLTPIQVAFAVMNLVDVSLDEPLIARVVDACDRLPNAGFVRALAERDLEAAQSSLDALPLNSYGRAKAEVLVARLATGRGEPDYAVSLLRHAVSEFHVLGAPVDRDRTVALIRRHDPSAKWRRPNRSPVTGIPDREADVLMHVCRGATNAEIAAQLHLSVATVKRVLTSLFRRFGAASRRELAERAEPWLEAAATEEGRGRA